jgi:hypothetical protein
LVRGSWVAGFTPGSGGFNGVSTDTSGFTEIRATGNNRKIEASERIGFPTSGLHSSRVTGVYRFGSRVQAPGIESLSQFYAQVRRKTRSMPLTVTHRQVLEDQTTGLLTGLRGSGPGFFSPSPSMLLFLSQSLSQTLSISILLSLSLSLRTEPLGWNREVKKRKQRGRKKEKEERRKEKNNEKEGRCVVWRGIMLWFYNGERNECRSWKSSWRVY